MALSNDILLWNGLRNGNEKDLQSLYTNFYDELLRYGFKMTSDLSISKEFINLLFLSLWKYRNKLPDAKNPKAYIITSYKNKIYRRKKSEVLISLSDFKDFTALDCFSTSSYEETLIELHESQITKNKINEQLSLLTSRQEYLMRLRFIDEMSYEEIALKENISLRTVYNSIHESLKMLRTYNGRQLSKLLSLFF